jgi:hypothetical protein
MGLADSAAVMAARIRLVISTSTLQIDAVDVSNTVQLTHRLQSSFGNQPIVETVSDGGFMVFGMSGGRGRDCGAGIGCSSNDDCAPGLACAGDMCTSTTLQGS